MTDTHAKKSLGQNWLVNEGVLDRIVEAARVTAADSVLEIGPGKGALTARLAATGARITAVEKDRRLIAPLRKRFADAPNVSVVEADALEFATQPGKVVANIPYYLTGLLLRRILEVWHPQLSVLMVQREVAARMLAAPPSMNLLALSVRLYAEPSLVMRVSRGSFRPVPAVDSAVVALSRIEPRPDADLILRTAKTAFAHKRKQLKASLPAPVLERAGISPSARPQELSLDDWAKVASALH